MALNAHNQFQAYLKLHIIASLEMQTPDVPNQSFVRDEENQDKPWVIIVTPAEEGGFKNIYLNMVNPTAFQLERWHIEGNSIPGLTPFTTQINRGEMTRIGFY